MSHRITVVVLALIVILSGLLAHAQITSVANDTITPIEGVGHDYIKMMSETVNPANGGLNIHIDMPIAKSRGLTVPFSITYDSNNVHHLNQGIYNNWGTVSWYANSSLLGQGGWKFALPYAHLSSWIEPVAVLTGNSGASPIYTVFNCGNVSNYVMQDLSGVTHSLGIGWRSGGNGDPNNYCGATFGSPGSDGKVEGFLLPPFTGVQAYTPALTVNDDVGTVYKFSISAFKPDGSTDANSYAALPDSIEDRNGNVARLAINASNAVTVTDSSGRTSISTSGFGPSGSTNTVTVSGATFQVTWRTVSANFSTQSVWAGNPGDPDPTYDNCSPPPSASDSQTVISQITLPNGKFYQFYYGNDVTPHAAATNPYGLVSEIDYPSGAWVLYSWKLNNTYNDPRDYNELADFNGVYQQACYVCSASCTGVPTPCPGAVRDGCRYQYKTPVVASRRVSFGGSSPSLTQSFVYSTNWGSGSLPLAGWAYKTTTVTTTDNTTGKTAITIYTYKPVNVPPPPLIGGSIPSQIAVEQSEQYSDWNGAQLRTVTKDWLDPVDMILDQTTIPGGGSGISSQKQYTYVTNNTYFKEPLETDEYDFGASAPTRKTVTTYQSFSGVPGTSGSPGALAGAPCKVLTSDGSGNPVAETDYLYDGGSVVCGTPGSASTADLTVTLVPGTHDESLYPAGPGTPRANVTSIIKWLNGGTSPTTSYSYDKTGHVISATDARGNTTNYSYADAFTTLSGGSNVPYTPTNGATNAMLTKITDPLGHVATFKYDYTTSQLTSSTDPNSQTTGYIYNDFFARPTQANMPDGGQTTVAYNDSAYNPSLNTPSVTTTKMITSGLNEVNIAAADGLGHVVRAILNSDPDGADTTDTTYDGFGRALTQSNPHRSGASPTDGTTTNTYDALGRTTSVLRPDNSVVSTAYDQVNGNTLCTSVTAETGKSRKSCSDGLGRLVQVFEDPSGVNYETDYAYDTLGNLLTVNQKGTQPGNSSQWRTRTFTYDSLSRLLTASNPESGTIRYTYDANGNVASKIAPQPNQTGSATVTTNYSYDVLNRLVGKSYVGMSTAGATYGYDGVAPTGCTPPSLADSYPVGRRTGMCDASGSASWAHDKMGRVVTESRKVNGFTRNVSYAYNLDGSLASLTYPSGRVVSYTPGGAGRPTAVADSTGPINYVQGAHYAPFGGLTDMTQGVTPITIKNRYSPRLQPVLLSAFTSSATIMSLCYDFHSGVALSSSNYGPCSFSATSSGDNGNVYQIVNNRDSNRTQNFMYDSLNRIQQAYSSGPNWGETYSSTVTAPGVVPPSSGIDAWGNMTNHVGVTGKTNTEGTFGCPANANNQLTACGLNYDAAGNVMSNNGVTYTYDAENRLVTPGPNNGTYLYDGDGNRMARLFSSSGTEYWLDLSGNTLLEDSNTGVNLREYIYFAGKKIARRDVVTNNVHYVFSDHLGSTSLMTDSLGTMAACNGYTSGQFESDYYPYGGEMSICNNLGDQNYKFTGKERDSESGLDNFDARHYGSSLGRFMQPDLMGGHLTDPQTLNRYAYVRNNPLALTDPTGLDFYLSCQQTDSNGSTCQQMQVGTDKNGNAQMAWVQGTTDNNTFTATQIGNDANGNLVDKTTGTGAYTASVNGSGVQFSNNGGDASSTGVFVNHDVNPTSTATTFQDAGWANNGNLSGFNFTFTNSKLEANQTAAGTFTFSGTENQAGQALMRAGFTSMGWFGKNRGFDEFRSPGSGAFGENSAHFNVQQVKMTPSSTIPSSGKGNMHFGEHYPLSLGAIDHILESGK